MSTLTRRTGEQLTLQLAPNEMAVQLRLADQELELPRLSRRFSLLFLDSRAVDRFLQLAPPHVALLLLVLLPEHEHLAHQPLALRLHILRAFRGADEGPAGLQ